MTQRVEWIDNLKGLGIIAVVAGHILSGPIKTSIYLFHMPLFFLLGGYLMTPSSNFRLFLKKKVVTLLIPYSSFLAILYPLQMAFEPTSIQLNNIYNILLKVALGGVLLTKWTGVFWFVTCFFAVQQIVNYLVQTFSHTTVKYIMVASLILGYIQSYYFRDFWLPWAVHIIPAAAPIFHAGFLLRGSALAAKKVSIPILVILVATAMIPSNVNYYDMKSNYFGIPVVTLISSITVIYLLTLLSKYIQKIKIINTFLTKIGKASMTIMYLHQAVQYTLVEYFYFPIYMRIIFAIMIPFILHHIFSANRITEFLLLGKARRLSIKE